MLRLCAFASGRGSNVRAIHAAIVNGNLRASLALVISNNSRSGALHWARDQGIQTAHISGQTHRDEGAAILHALDQAHIDVLVLAGYMKKLDARVVRAFAGRALNIHPGPLPRFGGRGMFGARVHQAVLDSGVTHSAATVHLVTAEYDEGSVLDETKVVVEPNDTAETLAPRVLAAEHDLYWRVIARTFVGAGSPAGDGRGRGSSWVSGGSS